MTTTSGCLVKDPQRKLGHLFIAIIIYLIITLLFCSEQSCKHKQAWIIQMK